MRALLLFLFLAGCATSAPDSALNWRKLDKPVVFGEGEQIRYMAGRNDTKTYYFRYEVGPESEGYKHLSSFSYKDLSKSMKDVLAPSLCGLPLAKDKLGEGYSFAYLVHKENQFNYTIARFEVRQSDCAAL